jgi:hypothetical protein
MLAAKQRGLFFIMNCISGALVDLLFECVDPKE